MARDRDFLSGNRMLAGGLAAAAGSAAKNGSTIDTLNASAATVLCQMGTIADNAVTTLKVQGSNTVSGTKSWEDIPGASISIPADGDDDLYVIEVVKPTYRFIRGRVERATANATIDDSYVILTGNRLEPVTHRSSFVTKQVTDS